MVYFIKTAHLRISDQYFYIYRMAIMGRGVSNCEIVMLLELMCLKLTFISDFFKTPDYYSLPFFQMNDKA